MFMDKISIPNWILIPQIGKLLAEGREVEMSPKGNSMLPFIREGKDSVVLKKLQDVSKGDIVLADLGKRYVLHRIIKIEGELLTLMGDGNLKGTERCSKQNVIGTVVSIVRGGRKAVTPGKGRVWAVLKPVRRYLLAFYKRLFM